MKNLTEALFLSAISFCSIGLAQEKGSPLPEPERSLLSSLDGRTFIGHLSPHHPIYFLYGSETPAAKFQFSFKYRLFDFLAKDESSNLHRSLNFAYTQRSLWDIEGDSSPFYDTSHMTEIIYELSTHKLPNTHRAFRWIGCQIAAKHESNGRDGLESRGLNAVYFRPVFTLGSLDDWHATLSPELFAYVSTSNRNADISDYRGYFQLRGSVTKNDGLAFNYTLGSGKDFNRLSYQVDVTIPLHIERLDFATYFQIQYFNGYGESLLAYNNRSDAFRLGISFVR